MPTGMYVSYTGAAGGLEALEVIANNVANASTAGFRRDQTLFDSVLAANMPYARTSTGGVDLSPGAAAPSGNPLHAALGDPHHFFTVEGPDGEELLTRRGDFQLDAEGRLALPSGAAVLGGGGPISVPADADLSLDATGRVLADGVPVARLRVVRIEDGAPMEKVAGTLLRPSGDAAPEEVGEPSLAPGFLEQSNVNLAAELVALIQASRSFEASMSSLRIGDEITQQLIQAQS